ncbi:MAG: oxygen-independent coproporphyrinogen III oxidase [Lachnospiraceae bacterium]|nr:oxygen-independent coproporphyrinogen III oxidase [Lachnospiraceae bacterium]
MKKRMGIYVHIPFCVKKCDYCDFLSFPLPQPVDAYLKALADEMRQFQRTFAKWEADTVFIGGGTPSLLTDEQMRFLLDEIRSCFRVLPDAEISMEMNPGTANADYMRGYRGAGVNRVSVGLQSACDRELALLGRIHTYAQFEETYRCLADCGFDNINVDIMSALPHQNMDTYAQTLEKVLALRPQHISSYSLIVEEGTPFFLRYGEEDCPDLPDEDADREMYAYTLKSLHNFGYHRYEISNYALEGRECRHNLKYWRMEPYLGLGLGSASYYDGMRLKNTENLDEYLRGEAADFRECKTLTRQESMEEFVFLGLRMVKGVSMPEFQRRFDVPMREIYGSVIDKYKGMQLLHESDGCLCLTERGFDVSNRVMAEFLL